MNKIGERLRLLRQEKGLTLQQVAEETGFALSFLSQLERDKVSINVDNLQRLANFYEVHMVHFFRTIDETPVQVIRRKDVIHSMEITAQGPAAVALLANRADARLEPLLIKIMPGEEEPHFREHDADTLLYVLEGEATLISEMGEETQLNPGDMAYYVNYPRKRLANRNQEQPLLVISITSPPTSSLDELIDMRKAAVDIPTLGNKKEN
jgi:transcriptional regulator with XRE-family HTH domain